MSSCTEFFVLSDPDTRGNAVVRLASPISWDEVLGLHRGTSVEGTSIVFDVLQGSRYCDFVWTATGILILVSQRVIDALDRAKISGWIAYPAAVSGTSTTYFVLGVTGRCGPLAPFGESIVIQEHITKRRPATKGLIFDPDSWDGSDVFLSTDDSAWVIVSDRVRRALREADITNVELPPAREVEIA